jgi:hypothetical protein
MGLQWFRAAQIQLDAAQIQLDYSTQIEPGQSPDSHKVYYGIFISVGITETCRQILSFQDSPRQLHGNLIPSPARLGPDWQISDRGKTAIDVEDVAGDKTRFAVVHQEQRRAGDLVR